MENYNVENLKRVEMFPFINSENLHPLIIVREESEKVEIRPEFPPEYVQPYPVYLMFFNGKTGQLKGVKLDLDKKTLITKWESELGFVGEEQIISVVGKPLNRKLKTNIIKLNFKRNCIAKAEFWAIVRFFTNTPIRIYWQLFR